MCEAYVTPRLALVLESRCVFPRQPGAEKQTYSLTAKEGQVLSQQAKNCRFVKHLLHHLLVVTEHLGSGAPAVGHKGLAIRLS
jgi:hypothetical protein